MEKPDDRYLWDAGKEESFPEISILQGLAGLVKFLFFLPFTLFLILLFLIFKILYRWSGVKFPMLAVRKLWSRATLKLCGLKLRVQGCLSPEVRIVVCNHVSWLDILAIQSVIDVVFVAKSEVKNWPGLGFLAKLADTLFVERKPQKIGLHSKEAAKTISMGKTICFFSVSKISSNLAFIILKINFLLIFL